VKLIGSKTGSYEYWIVFPNNFKIWMGVRPSSDTDVSIYGEETCEGKSLDIFYSLPWGPYVENGQLHKPESFDYLLYSLINKSRKQNATQILIDHYGKKAIVEEGSGNQVGEICLMYENSNNVGGRYLSDLAKEKIAFHKKHNTHPLIVNNISNPET